MTDIVFLQIQKKVTKSNWWRLKFHKLKQLKKQKTRSWKLVIGMKRQRDKKSCSKREQKIKESLFPS